MSFGISAATAAWVVAGATVAAGAYSADQNRKGLHEQQDALKASQEEDARKAAEAETNAMVAANAQLSEAKRRRRSSSLLTGGSETLGGTSTPLAGGAPAVPGLAARSTAPAGGGTGYTGTALGAGAPATRPATRGGVPAKRGYDA